ncbi:MAG TPA: TetR/AcrR family transcriptional regulator [Candidatus Dormibacteraeota bacterium]|nr:TetR/AcrR family transcriptional regulator [Candidatus Dormibacteraeota bacterium]
MTTERVEHSRRGRPRLQATDQAIFAAAADLIRERGYDGFSMAAVADRAGVAKTTVYRRWPTRSHLVLATMSSVMARVALFDTGDLRADLASFARSLAMALRAPGTRRLVAELALASAQRPELANGFHRLFIQRRTAALATVEKAVAAGHLRPGVDPELLIDQVSGALHYRMLVSGEGPSDSYAERLVDAVLDGTLIRVPERV